MKYFWKTIFCLLSGVKSVQHKFGEIIGWVDIEPETANYYSCFLFKNGRHIPVPLMFAVYGPTVTRIDGKICWTKFNVQEIIIFFMSKIINMKKIKNLLDQMDQENIEMVTVLIRENS